MRVEDGRIVLITYTLTDADGNLLDQATDEEPSAYLHGAPGIVPGLKAELKGKAAGDTFDVTILPEEAYGERNPAATQVLPRSQFPEDMDLTPGVAFSASKDGIDQMATIVEVRADQVMADFNHPLAGLTLRFQGSVIEVREATEDERASIALQ